MEVLKIIMLENHQIITSQTEKTKFYYGIPIIPPVSTSKSKKTLTYDIDGNLVTRILKFDASDMMETITKLQPEICKESINVKNQIWNVKWITDNRDWARYNFFRYMDIDNDIDYLEDIESWDNDKLFTIVFNLSFDLNQFIPTCYCEDLSKLERKINKSPKMKRWKKNIRFRAGHKCERCGTKKKLNVHHDPTIISMCKMFNIHNEIEFLNHKNVWYKWIGTLLCDNCHGDAHEGSKREKKIRSFHSVRKNVDEIPVGVKMFHRVDGKDIPVTTDSFFVNIND